MPPAPSPSAAEFAARVRACAECITVSHPASLAGLYDLAAARMVRYAATITRNQHDAEDAVQSVLVKVAGQPEPMQSARQPWSYLLGMVRNEALLILRRRNHWALFGRVGDWRTSPQLDELDQQDRHRAVWAALRGLPTEQSEVVVLKIWEEMTFAEIAEILAISPSTAASRYRYAIEKLTHKLRCEVAEVPCE